MYDVPIRRIRLENGENIRDLGGYETSDGRVTKFGCLFRAGGVDRLTAAEWNKLTALGVRTVLDLRSESEVSRQPDRVPEGISWYHCPLQEEQIDARDLSGSAEKAFLGSLTEGYLNIVRKNGGRLAKALSLLTEALGQGGVLFHCTAGKDRTGIVASSVLYLCGVEKCDIVADYEVTFTYNRKGMEKLLAALGPETGEKIMPYLRSDAESMERLVELYREIELEKYLASYGFSRADAELLRMRFCSETKR